MNKASIDTTCVVYWGCIYHSIVVSISFSIMTIRIPTGVIIVVSISFSLLLYTHWGIYGSFQLLFHYYYIPTGVNTVVSISFSIITIYPLGLL